MQLTNDDARFLVNLQKRMEESILIFPSDGEVEKYTSYDLDHVREFIFRVRPARTSRALMWVFDV